MYTKNLEITHQGVEPGISFCLDARAVNKQLADSWLSEMDHFNPFHGEKKDI